MTKPEYSRLVYPSKKQHSPPLVYALGSAVYYEGIGVGVGAA
jgi:hypothetical protein